MLGAIWQFWHWCVWLYTAWKCIGTVLSLITTAEKNWQESIKFSGYLKFLNQPYKKWSLEGTSGSMLTPKFGAASISNVRSI